MRFSEGSLYHIYNRGNNRQRIFFNRNNYLYFLEKVEKYLVPVCDLLAWCLMPNHFHFEIHANLETCRFVKETPIQVSAFSEGIRLLLSSYTKGIQVEQEYCGNLFQQKTKSKCLEDGSENYGEILFHYIHQNPVRAGLVKRLEDWEFSSFADYAGMSGKSLCNKEMAVNLFGLGETDFMNSSYQMISSEKERWIY